MKRLVLSVSILVSTLVVAGLLDHLPSEYEAAVYVGDLQSLYSSLKETTIGNALLNMMGLESMADNFVVSQLQAYEIDPQDFYSSLKEMLFVANATDVVLAFGPVKNAEKIKSALDEMIGDSKMTAVVDGYLVLYTSEKLLEGFKKGGGEVPEKISEFLKDPKVLGVSFNKTGFSEGYGKVWLENGTLISSWKSKALNDEGKKLLSSLEPKSTFPDKDLVGGDAFVMVNTGNLKEVFRYLVNAGVFGKDFQLDEKKLEKLGNSALACVEYSQALIQVLQGEEEEINGKLLAYMDISTTLEDLEKQNENCQVQNGYLVCDKFYMKPDKDRLWMYYPSPDVKLSGGAKEFFESAYTGNEVVLAYADFSKVLENAFGLSQSSYITMKIWIEGDELVGRLQIK